MRLAEGFWNSEYAKLEADEIVVKAGIWASEMADIPSHAVPELYQRTMRARGSDWAPTIGAFRAAWLDESWDFWADQNTVEEPKMLALPEPAPGDDGPGASSRRAQRAHLEKYGYFVCCDCINAVGFAPTTLLDASGQWWRCAESLCQFQLRNGEPANPPKPRPAKNRAEKQSQTTVDPVAHAQLEFLRRAAQMCEVDLDGMEPSDFVHFRLFVDWFGGRYPTTTLSRDMLDETWDRFAEEIEEKRAQDTAQRRNN